MAKQHVLLVGCDGPSQRVLGASLRAAGFPVAAAASAEEALLRAREARPALAIVDGALEAGELAALARSAVDGELTAVPLLAVGAAAASLGSAEPVDVGAGAAEVVARAKLLLARRDLGALARGDDPSALAGELSSGTVFDLVGALAAGRRTATLRLERGGRRGAVWFLDGRAIDAEAGGLAGAGAFLRLAGWTDGQYDIALGAVDRPERIEQPTAALVEDALRSAEQWQRARAGLEAPDAVAHLDFGALAERLGEIPDDANGVLRLVDGRRTLAEIADDAPGDRAEAADLVAKLVREGIVRAVAPPAPAAAADAPAPREWFAAPGAGEAPRTGPGTPPRILRFEPRARTSPRTTPAPLQRPFDAGGVGPAPVPPWASARPGAALPSAAPSDTPGLDLAAPTAIGPRGRHARRRRRVAMAAAAAAVAAAVGLGALAARDRRTVATAARVTPEAHVRGVAIEVDARDPEAYIALGELYLREDRPGDARRAFERYLALAPHGERAREAREAVARLK